MKKRLPLALPIFGLLFATLGTSAFAQTPNDLNYACEVIIAANDVPLKAGFFRFSAVEKAGTHGGSSRLFKEGAHEVEVVADAQWLGIRWSRNGKKIAESVFVIANMDRTLSRVAILYDPSDNGDQVSLGCMEEPNTP